MEKGDVSIVILISNSSIVIIAGRCPYFFPQKFPRKIYVYCASISVTTLITLCPVHVCFNHKSKVKDMSGRQRYGIDAGNSASA